MAQLIPIKITIKRGDKRKGEDAMKYPTGHNGSIIDSEGLGMHYGKTMQIGLGHDEEFAVTAVPQWYLDEYIKDAAKAGEEALITVLTEAEAEAFFAEHIPEDNEVVEDKARLEILALKAQAGITLTVKEKNAFDPNKPEKGIKLNDRRGFKKKLGNHTIKV